MEPRGTRAEARAPVSAPISPSFTINLHNFTFLLGTRGSEERRKTACGLLETSHELFFVFLLSNRVATYPLHCSRSSVCQRDK